MTNNNQLELFSPEEIDKMVNDIGFESGPRLMVSPAGPTMCIGQCKDLCRHCRPADSEDGRELLRRLGYLD